MVPEGEPQQTVSVQLYRNDTPFSPYPNRAPPRHEALSVDGEVAGVLIDPVLESDQGTVYHCAVVRGGGPVATSDRTTLFVGGESGRMETSVGTLGGIKLQQFVCFLVRALYTEGVYMFD